MEIRKADSKGRLTVGVPETQYHVRRYDGGAVLLEPVSSELVIQPPAPKAAVDYIASFGLDPQRVSIDGVDRYGYYRRNDHADATREDWPEGFDFDELKRRVLLN